MNDGDATALTRRDFIALTALGALGLGLPRFSDDTEQVQSLYVGTYTDKGTSKGIYQLRLSCRSGALTVNGLAVETANPSFIAMSTDGLAVYAVNELAMFDGQPTGSVTAFTRNRATNALALLARQQSGGSAPCYVSLDRSGHFLLVANYAGGSVSVFPLLADGAIGTATAFAQHVGSGRDPMRQASPHAHCVIADQANRFLLVADLGLDRIFAYRFDDTKGTIVAAPGGGATLAPGSGPRHLVLHPDGRTLYVTNELDSTVSTFRYDSTSGALALLQTLPAVSEPMTTRNAPADIHLHPDGKLLYVSNRGHNSIAAFSVDAGSGELTPLALSSTGGDWPRNFAIDSRGEFLLVANQRSNAVGSFRINRRTGRLTATGHSLALDAPVCIRFLPADA